MNTHVLKTDRDAFQAVISGKKKYEIRLDDRGFEVGDRLDLLETVSTGAEMKAGAVLEYTSGQYLAIVTHILRGPIYGLAQGWVIMSIEQDTSLTPEVSEAGQAEASYRDGVLAAERIADDYESMSADQWEQKYHPWSCVSQAIKAMTYRALLSPEAPIAAQAKLRSEAEQIEGTHEQTGLARSVSPLSSGRPAVQSSDHPITQADQREAQQTPSTARSGSSLFATESSVSASHPPSSGQFVRVPRELLAEARSIISEQSDMLYDCTIDCDGDWSGDPIDAPTKVEWERMESFIKQADDCLSAVPAEQPCIHSITDFDCNSCLRRYVAKLSETLAEKRAEQPAAESHSARVDLDTDLEIAIRAWNDHATGCLAITTEGALKAVVAALKGGGR